MHLEIRRDFDFREPILLVEPRRIKAPLLDVRADAKGQTMSRIFGRRAMRLG